VARSQLAISEASELLGVSDDTLRRWADAGRLALTRSASGRLVVDGKDLAALALDLADDAGRQDRSAQSARNQFRGIVTRVVKDTVMAQVELQAGPFRVVSLMSREAADELGLEVGTLATASVKATQVVVGLPERRRTARSARPARDRAGDGGEPG
jgi:molybdopterin-binding protein